MHCPQADGLVKTYRHAGSRDDRECPSCVYGAPAHQCLCAAVE